MRKHLKPSQFVTLGLCVFGFVAVAVALFTKAVPLEFWPLESPQDFVQRITPVIVVTVFMERALEVFISAWRGAGERKRKAAVRQARAYRNAVVTAGVSPNVAEFVRAASDAGGGPEAGPEHREHLAVEAETYKAETQRIALIAGLVFGTIMSAAGVRTLSLFFYPDRIEALREGLGLQWVAFTTVDILVTAAVIAGGADGLHQIINTFLSFFTTAKARFEAANPLNTLAADRD